MTPSRLPAYFISHGGGPWPWMKDQHGDAYDRLEASLAGIPRSLATAPTAVLVVSGHWEEARFTVQSAARPPMLYDYYGFPEHTYRVTYGAPGSPALAARITALLRDAGIDCATDGVRGYDHGTFAPMHVMFPAADLPVVQLSLVAGYDPAAHLALGRALAPLRDEGVLLVASGLSWHNMRVRGPVVLEPSQQFDAWLQQTLVDSAPAERTRRLLDWEQAPSARVAHPSEDHLIPLMVAVGAAEGESAECVYREVGRSGAVVSGYRFGGATTMPVP